MLVDYGASTSVISKSIIDEIEKRMGTTLPRTHTDVHIRSYGGHSVPSEGTVITTLEIGGRTFNTPFTITPYETATKVILGTTPQTRSIWNRKKRAESKYSMKPGGAR